MTITRTISEPWRLGQAGLAFLASIVLCGAIRAQEPYDEDEWYDPTDWFDGNNIEWDDTYEWWDEGRQNDWGPLGYDYYDPYYWNGFGYDSPYYGDERYGWHYEWDPVDKQWDRSYGWYDDYYDYANDAPGYGWHYEWNEEDRRWQRAYGWHDDYYEYPAGDAARESSSRDRGAGQSGTGSGPEQRDQQQRDWQQREQRQRGQGQRDQGQRTAQQGRDSGRSQDRAGREVIAGTIESFNRVRRGDGDKVLIRVRMRDGRSRLIDLGSDTDLQQLGLRRGQPIRIRGESESVDGRDTFVASAITVGDDRTQIRGPSRSRPDQTAGADQQRRDQERRTQSQQHSGANVTFGGRLAGLKEISVRGARDQHLLLRMEMRDGSSRVVDLGPTGRLGRFDIERGDQITVRGRTRSANGRTVLIANSLRIDGKRVAVDRRRAGEPARRRDEQRAQQRALTGMVDSVRRVEPDGMEQHLILRVTLDDGTEQMVDFGSEVTLAELDLRSGDRVRIAGQRHQRGDEPLFVAREVQVNGKSIDVGRGDANPDRR